MKTIWTIMKKELIRVFKDPKLFLVMFILPGLMIYCLYSIMGSAIKSNAGSDLNETSHVLTINGPTSFLNSLKDPSLEFKADFAPLEPDSLEEAKSKLLTKEVDYIVAFDEDFEAKALAKEKPSIAIYYNPTESRSSYCNSVITTVLASYQKAISSAVYGDTEVFVSSSNQIFDKKTATAKSLSMLLPFLIITFLFQGAMSVGPESIAGEKDRGTIATLLSTPAKRSDIAIGKLISLSILAILSAVSSFIGIMCSLPKLLQSASVDINIYSPLDYFFLLLVLVSTILIIMGLIVVLSAFAKNVKEASMIVSPVMILSMLVGIFTMFSTTAASSPFLYLIPLFNSVEMFLAIFTFQINYLNLAITIASNILYASILAYCLTKEFNSEKIMFAK